MKLINLNIVDLHHKLVLLAPIVLISFHTVGAFFIKYGYICSEIAVVYYRTAWVILANPHTKTKQSNLLNSRTATVHYRLKRNHVSTIHSIEFLAHNLLAQVVKQKTSETSIITLIE